MQESNFFLVVPYRQPLFCTFKLWQKTLANILVNSR